MKQGFFTVLDNRPLTSAVYRMTLAGDAGALTRPGQFVNIRLDGLYLRRPISVCDREGDTITLIYKVVGRGTAAMAALAAGTRLDLLTGLGNGYDTAPSGPRPLLLGGGVGIPPLFWLAKALIAEGKAVTAILGFNTASEIFLAEAFRALGAETVVTTADGSAGLPGFVTDGMKALEHPYTYFYTCGPLPMLRAVDREAVTGGQFSFEERMGCGFGACMGCTCQTKTGPKRICREGPVLKREEIVW